MRRGSSALRCKDSARRWSTRHSWPITDHTHPTWRATSLGDYRFWRDLGYAIGALLSGAVADFVGLGAAIHLDEESRLAGHGKTVLDGALDESLSVCREERRRELGHGLHPALLCGGEHALDVLRPSDLERVSRQSELLRGRLGGSPTHLASAARIPQQCDPAHPWNDLRQQLQSLGDELGVLKRQPGDIPAGPGKALDEAEREGLVNDRHDDLDGCGRLLDGANGLRSRGHDDVHGQCDELRRDPREVLGLAIAPPRFDQDVLALEPAQVAEPFPESSLLGCQIGRSAGLAPLRSRSM